MIANNLYEGADMLRPFRTRIDRGLLGLYVARSTSPFDFMTVLFDAVASGLTESGMIDVQECKSCRIASSAGLLAMTVDGEALEVPSPVDLEIKPKALRVLAPAIE